MRLRKRVCAFALAGVVLVPLSGCGRAQQDRDRAIAAIDATEQRARDFVYSDVAAGRHTVVDGSIGDDLRYRLDAGIDGTHVASEVVVDDALALQATDARALGVASLPQSLAGGQWVVDKSAATTLTSSSAVSSPGREPLQDAIAVLQYVRDAVEQAQTVNRFNPDSEAYRPKYDPFPQPQNGETRYDLVAPPLPVRQGANALQLQEFPGVPFFRQMSIYVAGGAVVSVRERISVVAQLLDPASNLEVRLGDFVQVPEGASIAAQARALLAALNRRLRISGLPLIRERTMEVDFRTPQRGDAPIELPDNATAASLSGVAHFAQVLHEAG